MINSNKMHVAKPLAAVDIVERDLGIRGNAARERSVDDETEKLAIAEKVYAVRASLGLSVRKFAAMVGVKETAISRLERADYPSLPSVRTLDRIARAAGYRLRVDFISVGPSGAIGPVRAKSKPARQLAADSSSKPSGERRLTLSIPKARPVTHSKRGEKMSA